MKMQKNAKTELERRLEEEMLREAHSEEVVSGVEHPAEEEHAQPGALSASNEEALAQMEAELNYTKDQLLRTHAEFDNYRKRTARDYDRLRKMAAENLIGDLLPGLDNLELALQHKDDVSGGFAEGVEMVLKHLSSTLERHGVSPIPALGERFNPRVHEAVTQLDDPGIPADHVAQEFQRGYMLGDQVLRPSKVAVSRGAESLQVSETGEG